jgi:hypothetical protein
MTNTDTIIFFIILGAAFLLYLGVAGAISNYLELLDERPRPKRTPTPTREELDREIVETLLSNKYWGRK